MRSAHTVERSSNSTRNALTIEQKRPLGVETPPAAFDARAGRRRADTPENGQCYPTSQTLPQKSAST